MWVAETQYDVLGTRFGVRSDDEWVAKTVDSLLTPFTSPRRAAIRSKNMFALANARPGDDRHHAYRDCKRIARSDSWPKVFDSFLAELNRRAIDEMAYFGVHAGVVATGTSTIAFPAATGAGKSTLVAACLQAGFRYVSDEALVVDYSTDAVVPYPKPLNLSRWSIEKLGLEVPDHDSTSDGAKMAVSPDQFRAEIAAPAPELSAVVFLERLPGKPALEKLPRSQVIAGLLQYSFNHYRRPAEAFRTTSEQARHCESWLLTYDNPIDAADLMLSELT